MGDRFGDLLFALLDRSGQVGTDGTPVSIATHLGGKLTVRAVLKFAPNTGRLRSETPGVRIQGEKTKKKSMIDAGQNSTDVGHNHQR